MSLCKICFKPECLGIGRPGNREGNRCAGTIDTECDLYPIIEERLEKIVEYQLECFYHSRAGLPLNGRQILSLIKEIRELRKQKGEFWVSIGDEVVIDDGPILGTTTTAFITSIKMRSGDGGIQIGYCNTQGSSGGAPLGAIEQMTGRIWSSKEKEVILGFMKKLDR